MTGPPRARAAIGAVLLILAAFGARADDVLVPGRMGYNALPALRTVDPVVGPEAELELAAATQVSGLAARDTSATPYFRLTVPFREVAALELDGVPFELFRISSDTTARFAARERAGIAPGDLRAGARFLLVDEGRRLPALGLSLTVKAASGKDRHARRFTNAPGYVFDLLAGKDLPSAGPVQLRALAKVGFLAWQVGEGRQDDAADFGATLQGVFRSGLSLLAEWRGYAGWRGDDKPMVLGVTAGIPVGSRLEVRVSVDRGLTPDAPPFDAKLGFVLFFDAPQGRSRAPILPGRVLEARRRGADPTRDPAPPPVTAPR